MNNIQHDLQASVHFMNYTIKISLLSLYFLPSIGFYFYIYAHTYTHTLFILTTNDIPLEVYSKIDLLILQLMDIYIVILIILFIVIKMLYFYVPICTYASVSMVYAACRDS